MSRDVAKINKCYNGQNILEWVRAIDNLASFNNDTVAKIVGSYYEKDPISHINENFPCMEDLDQKQLNNIYKAFTFISSESENVDFDKANEIELVALEMFYTTRLLVEALKLREDCFQAHEQTNIFFLKVEEKEYTNHTTALLLDHLYAKDEEEKTRTAQLLIAKFREYEKAKANLINGLEVFKELSRKVALKENKEFNSDFNPNPYINYHIFKKKEYKIIHNYLLKQDALWKDSLAIIQKTQIDWLDSKLPTPSNKDSNRLEIAKNERLKFTRRVNLFTRRENNALKSIKEGSLAEIKRCYEDLKLQKALLEESITNPNLIFTEEEYELVINAENILNRLLGVIETSNK